MRNHDAEEERALYPREMDIRGSITTFYCISISFPGGQRKRGKLEIERERERERERGGNCERLDYSGGEKEKGAASFSLAFSEKERCLK